MIYCQSCLTKNALEAEHCNKCGTRLLIVGRNQRWDEPQVTRFSMEDHFLERISNLEETVNNMLENLARISESLEVLDRNSFVTRSGFVSLIDALKETHLLREDLLYQRWETTMVEQMEEARYRDRFSQMRGRFLALYRGLPAKRGGFQTLIEEAEFLIYSDRFQESSEVLAKALKLDEQNYELAYYLAEFYQQQGHQEQAVRYLELALKANPDHADSLLVLALLHYGEERVAEAERLLARCIEVNPNNPGALISLASVLIAQQRGGEARPLLERVNEMDPQAQGYFLSGLIAKQDGKFKQTIDNFNLAIELDPNHEDAVFNLGMAYLERGWTRKAKACFSRALELNPNKIDYEDPPQLEETQPSQASEDLEEDSKSTLQFAQDLFRAGKPKQALTQYRQLLKKHSSNPMILSGYAITAFSLRRYGETIKIAQKILRQGGNQTARCLAYTLQMESLRALGHYEEALEILNNMLAEFSEGYGYTIANYGLAITKADMGQDLPEAEIMAEKALATTPPEFRHNALDALGWVCFKQGRLEEALKFLESALSMHETINHLYHYGMILLGLNLQDQAFKVFERTVALKNKSARVEDFIFSALEWSMDPTDPVEHS